MKTYKLVANTLTGASVEFTGNSMTDVKMQFENTYSEIQDFEARIYDNENGAFCQFKPMGAKTYQIPQSR